MAQVEIPEADKPWWLTIILLTIFTVITLAYSYYLSYRGLADDLKNFINTVLNIVVGWCGIGIGYYLRGRAK